MNDPDIEALMKVPTLEEAARNAAGVIARLVEADLIEGEVLAVLLATKQRLELALGYQVTVARR